MRGRVAETVYAIPELPSEQRAPEDHLRRVFSEWVVEATGLRRTIACASAGDRLTTQITTVQNSSNPNPSDGQSVDVLIMAAGLGTRMKSNVAKVLHKLDGRPLISHVCRSALALNPGKVVVIVGHQAEEVRATVEDEFASDRNRIAFVHQIEQRGTGDAVIAAENELRGDNRTVLVLSGDVPLIRPATLTKLIDAHHAAKAACVLLSVRLENPTGYGRVMRDDAGDFVKIVEQKDATEEERQIREINAGIYCFESAKLVDGLSRVKPNNAQGEFYLTDVPAILKSDGDRVAIYLHGDAREVSGINTRAELGRVREPAAPQHHSATDDRRRRDVHRSVACLRQQRGKDWSRLCDLSGRAD